MLLVLGVLVLAPACASAGAEPLPDVPAPDVEQTLPPHAVAVDRYGTWTCERGYLLRMGRCISEEEAAKEPRFELSEVPSAGDGATWEDWGGGYLGESGSAVILGPPFYGGYHGGYYGGYYYPPGGYYYPPRGYYYPPRGYYYPPGGYYERRHYGPGGYWGYRGGYQGRYGHHRDYRGGGAYHGGHHGRGGYHGYHGRGHFGGHGHGGGGRSGRGGRR
jgi:hypothetical protein